MHRVPLRITFHKALYRDSEYTWILVINLHLFCLLLDTLSPIDISILLIVFLTNLPFYLSLLPVPLNKDISAHMSLLQCPIQNRPSTTVKALKSYFINIIKFTSERGCKNSHKSIEGNCLGRLIIWTQTDVFVNPLQFLKVPWLKNTNALFTGRYSVEQSDILVPTIFIALREAYTASLSSVFFSKISKLD